MISEQKLYNENIPLNYKKKQINSSDEKSKNSIKKEIIIFIDTLDLDHVKSIKKFIREVSKNFSKSTNIILEIPKIKNNNCSFVWCSENKRTYLEDIIQLLHAISCRIPNSNQIIKVKLLLSDLFKERHNLRKKIPQINDTSKYYQI